MTTTYLYADVIQQDMSGGQGHCWRTVDAGDIPANIIAEIEAEIINGKREECDDFTASNGQHYRWEKGII